MPRVSVGRAALDTRPHILYRFYDRTGVLLYIGITVDLGERMKAHAKDKLWWSDVDRSATRIEYLDNRRAALDAEREAIKAEKPLENDQHNEWVEESAEPDLGPASHFLRELLIRMLDSEDEAQSAIRDAARDMTEFTAAGIMLEGATPEAWAALRVAERVSGALRAREAAIQQLLTWLPDDVVTEAYAGVEQQHGPGSDDFSFVQTVLAAVDGEMSRRLLAELDAADAEHCRKAALLRLRSQHQRGMEEPSERAVVKHAAGYARAMKSRNQHLFTSYRCSRGRGTTESCTRLAAQHVVFNECTQCGTSRGGCSGHGLWCRSHLNELFYQPSSRVIEVGD
jgi:predicted GIY-YIG superfamily endonuclease